MQINLVERDVYGKTLLYPACEKAELFCKMIKSKTMPDYQVDNVRRLGYSVIINGNLEKILGAL